MSDSPPEPIDTEVVRRLAAILDDTGLTEIEVERGDLKIRVARTVTVAAAAPMAQAYAPSPVQAPTVAPAETTSTETAPAGETVKSPMVGAAYLQAEPGSPPFVKVGDTVQAGQTLLIIEAMKTMNPVPAPKGGVVRAVLVSDGQPVEYGQPLVVIA